MIGARQAAAANRDAAQAVPLTPVDMFLESALSAIEAEDLGTPHTSYALLFFLTLGL